MAAESRVDAERLSRGDRAPDGHASRRAIESLGAKDA